MKSLTRSIATIDTHSPLHTHTTLHNCPSCRCRSTDLSLYLFAKHRKLTHTNSQPTLAAMPEYNLYLSTHLTEAVSDRHSNKAYHSTIFQQQKANKITFKYAPATSPKHANISFSYTSPPKARKHHSSEARFSTRKFKKTHFPQLNQQEESVTLKKIVGGRQSSPYYELYTGEKTPEKHRILKMKKEKPKQKQQITLSKKSSSQQSKEELEEVNYNDYELEGQKISRMNGLWVSSSQRTLKDTNKNQHLSKEITPQSYVQTYSKEVRVVTSSPTGSQQLISPSLQPISNKKYPTIQSIDAREARVYVENVSEQVRTNCTREEISLRLGRESKGSSIGRSEGGGELGLLGRSQQIGVLRPSEEELAVSLSQELDLHYDYYYPEGDSDQSLSIHVTL